MEDVVGDEVNGTFNGVVKSVNAVIGEDYLLARPIVVLRVDSKIVGSGVLFKNKVVVDVEGEKAPVVVGVEVVGA